MNEENGKPKKKYRGEEQRKERKIETRVTKYQTKHRDTQTDPFVKTIFNNSTLRLPTCRMD